MNPVRSGGEISYAVLEVIYDDRKVRQSAVHKCHAQLPCKCLARYQARPCLALRTALVHGKIPKPGELESSKYEFLFSIGCKILDIFLKQMFVMLLRVRRARPSVLSHCR